MFSVSQFEARTLSWWFNQRSAIDMSPKYQRRGGIWSVNAKAFLIDSILNDFDIPKLYLANFTFAPSPLNEHNTQFAVIDGKQRLEAIFDFFESKFPLQDEFALFEDTSLPLGGLTYKDLKAIHPGVASKFENFNLSVMSVVTDEEAKINELFVRLNTSKPLTGAEVRNAMAGVVPDLIRELAGLPFFTEKIRFSVQRGEDLNTAAKMLMMEFRGRVVDTKKLQLDRFVEEGVQAEAKVENFRRAARRANGVLRLMNQIFVPKDPLLGTQGQVPVYYWLVRTLGSDYAPEIRPFIVQFESDRADNRAQARQPNVDQATLDSELLRYDTLNRSVNDQGSLEGRFEILERRFRALHRDASSRVVVSI